MNSTKLVLKNWFHFFFFLILLLLLFAFGHFFSSQEDCVLFKMPGTSEKGGFSPAPCSSPLRDLPSSLCFCGCAIPRKDRAKKGQESQGSCSNILRIQLVQFQSPKVKPCSNGLCCPGQGEKAASVSAPPEHKGSRGSTPSGGVDPQEIV